MKISVAIVEDDKNYNNALKKIIDFQEDMFCSAQFFNGKNAKNELENLAPDVILMDIQLQDMLGISIIEELKKSMPNSQFIMCTSFEDDEKIFSWRNDRNHFCRRSFYVDRSSYFTLNLF